MRSSSSHGGRLPVKRLHHRGSFRNWPDRAAWGLIVLGILLLQVPRAPLFELLVPLQTVLLAPLRVSSSLHRRLAAMHGENERLAQLAARLAVENARLRSAVRLAGGAQTAFPGLPVRADVIQAAIIARDIATMQRYLILSRGRRHRIVPGTPVLSPEGLVGTVVASGSHQSLVQTILDFDSRTAAQSIPSDTSHESGPGRPRQTALGVVRSDRTGRSWFEFVDRDADVRPGDTVVTSGLGGVLPRGLLVGVVTRAESRATELFRHIELRPAAAIASLEYVFLLPIPGSTTALPADDGHPDESQADPWLDNLLPREVRIPGEDQ
ncbi:MAG: rod shape-determining protein MreC [bacterium]